ncbi:bifunctional 4-hydroxy-2-oxoglutarate aldolase/2-dehydro-3-deoxy-phosphogluconate aldolase [bacterium]|nr:bifunctional 4-hydroxy-2-oxoglutarate aldolase/2-dehydro-3-deoxy-phosphogluconate aldolase [bacterium]
MTKNKTKQQAGERSEQLFQRLKTNRLIALFSPENPGQCVQVYEALNPLGVTLEVAFRTPAAAAGIQAIIRQDPEARVIAGTVMTADQAARAMEAGASGIVSADYMPEVVESCCRHDILCVPGGLGDVGKQLAQKAALYGCAFEELQKKHPYQWIHKLFPAVTRDAVFAGLAQAWKGPFPGLQLIYTGGITLENIGDLAKRDAGGIFCASALSSPASDPDQMTAAAKEWISKIEGSC